MTIQEHFPQAVACPGGFWEITVGEYRALGEGIHAVDVRESEELMGARGLLSGVEHVPMAKVPDASKGWDMNAPLVLICRSGGRSAHAALWLQQQGFTKVVSLRGGMLEWSHS